MSYQMLVGLLKEMPVGVIKLDSSVEFSADCSHFLVVVLMLEFIAMLPCLLRISSEGFEVLKNSGFANVTMDFVGMDGILFC